MMSNNNRVTSMIIHHVDKNPYIIENSHRLCFKLVIIPLIPWKYTSGYYSINMMMSNNGWVNTSYIIENSHRLRFKLENIPFIPLYEFEANPQR